MIANFWTMKLEIQDFRTKCSK